MQSFCNWVGTKRRFGACLVVLAASTLGLSACAGPSRELAFQEEQKGKAFYRRGEFQGAMDHYLLALGMQQKSGDLAAQADLLNRIAFIYANQGDTSKALEYINQALKLLQQTPAASEYARALSNLGAVYLSAGRTEDAVGSLVRAAEIQRAGRDDLGLAESLYRLGRARSITGTVEGSLAAFHEAGNILRRLIEIEPFAPQATTTDKAFQWLTRASGAGPYLGLLIVPALVYALYKAPEWEASERTYLEASITRLDARVLAADRKSVV